MTTRTMHSGDATHIEQKTDLLRLHAEIKQRADSGSEMAIDFLRSAVSDIRRIKGSRYADLRFDCLAKAVPTLYAAGEYEAALLAADEAIRLGNRLDRPDLLRLAENFAGAIHGERGNLAQAVIHYETALTLAVRMKDHVAEASVSTNLGILFQYAGLYREAVPCHRRAIALVMGTPKDGAVPSIYCNLAQTFLAMGDVDEAHDAITRALALSREPETPYAAHARTIREWTYVDVALERNDIPSARRHVDECSRYALLSGTRASVFQARLARGLFSVYADEVDQGLLLLEGSLRESEHHGEARRVDAIVALVKAYEICDRPEPALWWMNELMRHLAERRREQSTMLLGFRRSEKPSAEYMDLHAWKYRQARLRAAVAEHEVVNARQEMLERLAITASLKEDASGEHGYRVGKLSALMAQTLGWSRERSYLIEIAARLHDIGKVGIPDRILLGSQELKDAERRFMQSHTLMGAELLAKSDVPQLKMAEEVARHHHEHWDGNGYPSSISGDRIPLHARIVALADVFDALTHGRPYAAAWAIEDALTEMHRLAGTHFDPELTHVFIQMVSVLRAKHHDLDVFLGEAARESNFLQARKKLKSLMETQHYETNAPVM